jgi:hypothetical protein
MAGFPIHFYQKIEKFWQTPKMKVRGWGCDIDNGSLLPRNTPDISCISGTHISTTTADMYGLFIVLKGHDPKFKRGGI